MQLNSNFSLNLPSIDSLDNYDLGKSLELLRYLQRLQNAGTTESGTVKSYVIRLKQRIKFLVIG